jgi:DNA-binding CsgD family transcriptional regulator
MAIRGFLTTLGLSRQEEQVLILSISGLADKEVAKELGIALETVRTYWQRIRRKVGGQTRAELVARLVSETAQKEIDEKASENERLVSEIARRKTAEQRFRAITDASPLGIFVTDPQGKCVYSNSAWQTITGSTLIEAREGGWLSMFTRKILG